MCTILLKVHCKVIKILPARFFWHKVNVHCEMSIIDPYYMQVTKRWAILWGTTAKLIILHYFYELNIT